jgi:hypothetical protein
MNNYKSVRNRLFKNSEVELKSESVELALVDDLNKAIQATEDLFSGIESSVSFAKKVEADRKALLSDLPKLRNEANKVFDKGASFLDKAQTASQELGIKTSNIKNYDKLENNLNVLARDIDSIIQALKSIS